jgi:hypothetical protein
MMESTTGQHDGSEPGKDQARQRADEAKDWARSAFDDRKRATADEVGGLAQAAHHTADQLHRQGQDATADYVNSAADALQRFSGTLRDGDVNSLVRRSQDFARQRPVLFLSGAVAIGFALSRFLTSSATRNESDYRGSVGGERDHRHEGQRTESAAGPAMAPPPVLGDAPNSGGTKDGQ